MTGQIDGLPFPEITDETVERYRANYLLPTELAVTKQMVLQHVALEYDLTQTLLNSVPAQRAGIWADSMTDFIENCRGWRIRHPSMKTPRVSNIASI